MILVVLVVRRQSKEASCVAKVFDRHVIEEEEVRRVELVLEAAYDFLY